MAPMIPVCSMGNDQKAMVNRPHESICVIDQSAMIIGGIGHCMHWSMQSG